MVESPEANVDGATRLAWYERATSLLKDYDEAMASQAHNLADAKLIVMANYGDLCADLLRAMVRAGGPDLTPDAPNPSLELQRWAERNHVHFVSRSAGQYTTGVVSRDALIELLKPRAPRLPALTSGDNTSEHA